MRIWNKITNEPWATTSDTLENIINIAKRQNANPEAIAAQLGRKQQNTYAVSIRNNVAVIPIHGPLFRYANLFTVISGATSYELLARDFNAALENQEVKAILFDIDSPGGEVNGCSELADMIYQARGKKPIIAYASGNCCSGAYWIAAACDEIVVTDIKTAEMTKVVENTFRAVNIAFANELARICRHDNMDVYEIIKICNMHPRVNILQPGPGVGGHCISVDPWFLVGDYPSLAKVIDESMKTNDSQPDFVLNRIYEIMKENHLADVNRVGLYGLTYKENVDDLRESPTLQLLESQERHLATGLKVYDPFVTRDVVSNQYHDLDKFLADVDMVVIMVKHNEIKENVDKLKGKVILDCHNIINLPNVYHI